MGSWLAPIAVGMAAGALQILWNIFREVRSIRRMMNDDRAIPSGDD